MGTPGPHRQARDGPTPLGRRAASASCARLLGRAATDRGQGGDNMTDRRKFIAAAGAGVASCLVPTVAGAASLAPTKAEQNAITPSQAYARLIAGNQRLLKGESDHRNVRAEVKATGHGGQYPYASILACMDSRCPPELIFDQGIGDIFDARIAGNFADTDMIGCQEFATEVAGAKVIMVLGHTKCGAIRGACDNVQLGLLTHTLSNLIPAVQAVKNIPGKRDGTNPAFVQAVADMNVRMTVANMIERSEILQKRISDRQLIVTGNMYDVETGKVARLV
jgi:carbonic anhydrase